MALTPARKKPADPYCATPVVAFAIDLARTEMAGCRPWEVARLRDALEASLGRDPEGAMNVRAGHLVHWPPDGRSPQDFSLADFEHLQKDVVAVLRPVSLPKRIRSAPGLKLAPLRLMILPDRDRSVLLVEGSVRDAFMFLLASALTQVPNKLVGRCPECDRLFLATGKRRYCDRTCTNKASMKKWLAKRQELRVARTTASG
jgi:hypothetical protein